MIGQQKEQICAPNKSMRNVARIYKSQMKASNTFLGQELSCLVWTKVEMQHVGRLLHEHCVL